MTKILIISLLSYLPFKIWAQRELYGEKMANVVTPIETYIGDKIIKATGIYYQHGYIDTLAKDTIVGDLYLVSNLHVFKPDGITPDSIRFALRSISVGDEGQAEYRWHKISIGKPQLDSTILTHENLSIDVAAINIKGVVKITDFINDDFFSDFISPVRKLELERYKDIQLPYIGDRIIVLGYPDGFYDNVNKLPVAKSGIVSTFFGRNYDGFPKYLIDSKLYKSFSGSIVIYLPSEAIVENKKLKWFTDGKPISFVGIYSGEVYVESNPEENDDSITVKKLKMDFGNVWYMDVLDEIIK